MKVEMKITITILLLAGLTISFGLDFDLTSTPPCPTGSDVTIKDGVATWKPDPCTLCTCPDKTPMCAKIDCVDPPCSDYVTPPGQCCPICPNGPDPNDAYPDVHG